MFDANEKQRRGSSWRNGSANLFRVTYAVRGRNEKNFERIPRDPRGGKIILGDVRGMRISENIGDEIYGRYSSIENEADPLP